MGLKIALQPNPHAVVKLGDLCGGSIFKIPNGTAVYMKIMRRAYDLNPDSAHIDENGYSAVISLTGGGVYWYEDEKDVIELTGEAKVWKVER